jgi:diguanylate cyclase (GGDEF)-like protein
MTDPMPQNLRVLVVDDNAAIHDDFRKILARRPSAADPLLSLADALFGDAAPAAPATDAAPLPGSPAAFEVDAALQGEAAVALATAARAAGRPYAVAFVDMRMPPGWDGLRTIRELWRVDPDLNVVVCTAFSDSSWDEIEAVGGRGDQLLVLKKPFEPIEVRRLATTLTAKWALARQAALKMSELAELVDRRTVELNHAATHDRLTGLPNRILFHERLTQALAVSRRRPDDYRVAVLFLDCDRFKVVNDSLGHGAGDQLLRAIGDRLAAAVRETDTVSSFDLASSTTARLGGDEFCIMLCGLDRDDRAATVATRVLAALERPFDLGGRAVHTTASIGIALSSSGYARAEDMVRDADTAMYRAKAEGAGRFVLFDQAMHEQAVRRLTVESDLRRAVTDGQLRMYLQPIVSMATGRMTGAEALVRWQHPERGLVPPGEFIGIAEESGLIDLVGHWMLEQCCTRLAAWQARSAAAGVALGLTVTVNASRRELAQSDFPDRVAEVVRRAGVRPGNLALEVTETALVRDPAAMAGVLDRIRAGGTGVYLDDFGTGYSSLSALHAFTLDGLKVDRSFVQAATTRPRHAAVLRAVADLARGLSMELVAEGIEDAAQLALLRDIGCTKGQGYLFARPMPADAFEQMLFGGARLPWESAAIAA